MVIPPVNTTAQCVLGVVTFTHTSSPPLSSDTASEGLSNPTVTVHWWNIIMINVFVIIPAHTDIWDDGDVLLHIHKLNSLMMVIWMLQNDTALISREKTVNS